MNITEEILIADIPYQTALDAHAGTSFSPEKRAEAVRKDYAAQLLADYAKLAALANGDSVKLAVLDREFPRYREAIKTRKLAYLRSRSRIVSVMIAGPSNFPVARMNKRNSVADARLTDLIQFRERAMAAIRKEMFPEDRPIMSGDADAVTRLEAELEKAKKLQHVMRAMNLAVRRALRGEEAERLNVLKAAAALCGWEKADDAKLLELLKPDYCGRVGFADFELTNNGANIRRMEKRLENLKATKDQPDTVIERENARIEDCPAENRVRLFFPGKPEAAVRDRLKSGGYRWTPTLGCWQAYRNSNSFAVAKEVAGPLVQPAASNV